MNNITASRDWDEPWQNLGACTKPNWNRAQPPHIPHNPDVFFPRRAEGGQCAPAKSICHTCPVRIQCLTTGIREPFGVWGGLSEKERREAHRMHKQGVGIVEILAYFDAIEPRRKRKAALPEVVLSPVKHGLEKEMPDVSYLIPTQRVASEDEVAARRRRNGL